MWHILSNNKMAVLINFLGGGVLPNYCFLSASFNRSKFKFLDMKWGVDKNTI